MNIFLDLNEKQNRYKIIKFLGEGQYGNVYKANDQKHNNKTVAIKKIKCGSRDEVKDGINRSAIREVKYLRELHHFNIINLIDVFEEENSINLVLEFLDTDLEVIIKTASILEARHIKNFSIQILRGLEYLHFHFILHRDIKPNNIFVNATTGDLKLGDFGLARHLASEPQLRPMTCQVCTLWYRSPELLFGVNLYGFGLDLWSVGCVIAEMFLRTPLFPGNNDLDQLRLIVEMIGSPNESNWPDYAHLENRMTFKHCPPTPFKSLFTALTDDMIELLQILLSHDPLRRGTCTDSLKHRCFSSEPYPCSNKDVVTQLITVTNKVANKRRRIE